MDLSTPIGYVIYIPASSNIVSNLVQIGEE